MRSLLRFLAVLTVCLLPVLPVPVAGAVGVRDLPAPPQQDHVLDAASLFSRATTAELEKRLADLGTDHIAARLVTVQRLDYGLDLESLGHQLLDSWGPAPAGDGSLLLLIDGQTNTAAVVASTDLLDQLPAPLLRSTAETTMAVPLRLGARHRQASLDALNRLETVLDGGEDPGPPQEPEELPVVSNVPTREETASGNGLVWVAVLLGAGTVVPMLTWWVFSR